MLDDLMLCYVRSRNYEVQGYVKLGNVKLCEVMLICPCCALWD